MDDEEIKLHAWQVRIIDEQLDDYCANSSDVQDFDEMLSEIKNSIQGLF